MSVHITMTMICLNQPFFIITDAKTLPRKPSKCTCRNLINLNVHTIDEDKIVCFRERDTAEIYRLKSEELTKKYNVNQVDSRDVVKLLDCFDLDLSMR